MVGTPYYMSPEQAASSDVFPQSDLYSCGVIMFLLATGTLPFVAPSPLDVATMHVKKRPPRPSSLNPRIDPRLETVILCCLAKDPWHRPASGTELAGMLDSITEAYDRSTRQELEETAARLRPKRQLRWTTAWAIGATSALAVFGAAQWSRGGTGSGVASASTAHLCLPAGSASSAVPIAAPPAGSAGSGKGGAKSGSGSEAAFRL
jgi:serine/threonine protein kinase